MSAAEELPTADVVRRVWIPSGAKCVFRGELFSIFQWQERLYDGSSVTFEMARRPDNVVVIAIGDDGRLLVTVQEQPGIEGPFYDFPGGRVEPAERQQEAAAREMLEETGFAARSLDLVFVFQASDRVDSKTSVFRAKGLMGVRDPNPDSGEMVRTEWLTLDEVQQWSLVNNRLAITPVLLARDIGELSSARWPTS